MSEAVNEGIERAHRDGILTHASLMVGAPAFADAVRRAKAMPDLRVGLHLVVIEGAAVLPPAEIFDLVDARGWFPSDQVRLGIRYFFSPNIRRQLAAEIRAQFAAFAATGLNLDHANAHKHMHLHPTVGSVAETKTTVEANLVRRHDTRHAMRLPLDPKPRLDQYLLTHFGPP